MAYASSNGAKERGSQRSAGGEVEAWAGPLRPALSGCGMTARSPISVRRRGVQALTHRHYANGMGKSWSITSSHSEAKEGMHSVDGRPAAPQSDADPQRPAGPPSSSPGGDANKSESDLDKLRVRPRSSLRSHRGSGVTGDAGLTARAHSAIVLEPPSAARGSSASRGDVT
ncbi:hypothetical protein EYF80_041945 [Liparis tanakae]|uniref:Uncharacterized protein n=1 Tax=Liparis tanakae TaxID=230148 RepID=A0A4Z2G3H1_9TELE|nr:hypothetical protein EYF80_041945 [Liparis tanakae]